MADLREALASGDKIPSREAFDAFRAGMEAPGSSYPGAVAMLRTCYAIDAGAIARVVVERRLVELTSGNHPARAGLLRVDGWNLDDNEHSAFEMQTSDILSVLFPGDPHA